MDDTAVLLARIQFAVTIGFHYLYPPLSIGLGIFLVVVEGIYLKTRDPLWRQVARFWTKVFALTFAIGVATGLVMEFEFGTNWARYSRYVGDVFGSALAAEGIFAFFLESGFLALLLFGWDKVGPKLHYFATIMVCLGAHFSAVWIVVANSWMHTPAGHHIVQGPNGLRAEITDFWALVFNPSSMDRLSHVLVGAWMAGAFLVLSISAWYLLKRRHEVFARASLKVGIIFAVVASLLQLVTGHASAGGVAVNQPAKFAAMEGHYAASAPADLTIVGWVDEQAGQVRGLSIPGGTSYLLHQDFTRPVTGLDAIPADERPPVQITFQAYHAMIAIGMGLIGLSLFTLFLWWRGRLESSRWLLWLLVFGVLGPQFANQLGWMAAEVGRQPWIVQGLMKTKDAVSTNVNSSQIIFSLILFTFVYLGLFAAFLYLLNDKIQHGPDPEDAQGPLVKLPQKITDALDGHRAEGEG
jgi:cytochrome d ubiquinol oxidase subunit I